MKRKIKFRAWDKDLKQMFPVWKLDLTIEPSITVKEYDGDGYFERRIKSHYLMQYIGLKDKKGKEIYEGDILEYRDKDGLSDSGTIVVGWDKKAAGWGLYYTKVEFEFMGKINKYDEQFLGEYSATCAGEIMAKSKIIGNIYENPELLT